MTNIQHTTGDSCAIDEELYGHFNEKAEGVEVHRQETFIFNDRIGSEKYPPAANRYHLYLAYVCPWAQRDQLIIDYLGLNKIISYSYVDRFRDARGWAFRGPTGPDPINGFKFLSEAYIKSDSSFKGVPSVPLLWDKKTKRIVNNSYRHLFVDLATQFNSFRTKNDELYPIDKKDEIDHLLDKIEEELFYRGHYALNQVEDEAEYKRKSQIILDELDGYEQLLGQQPYLAGDTLSAADIAFWVLIVRVNLRWSKIFRGQEKSLQDYPNIVSYSRKLYEIPEFKAVVQFDYFYEEYLTNNFFNETKGFSR
jgi:glutathionyl-hydroquinone reductase